MSKQFILASASSRRIEMLQAQGYDFDIKPSFSEEVLNEALPIEKAIEQLAYQKARDVFKEQENQVVLGADTLVVCDGQVLGKPMDYDDAKNILRFLSNKTHSVITGLCVISDQEVILDHEITEITFYDLTDEQIELYLTFDEAYDKAGAYAIQGLAGQFVKTVSGDYDNVVGLPLAKTKQLLEKQGILLAK